MVALRRRQQRNFLALLFLSQGVPMLLAGDELGRTPARQQQRLLPGQRDLLARLVARSSGTPISSASRSGSIRFRKAHPSLRRRTFFEDEARPAVAWHGTRLGKPDWTGESRVLAMHLLPTAGDEPIYLVANAHWEAKAFELPRLPAGKSWRRFLDTSLPPGDDALEPGAEAPVAAGRYAVGPRSVVVLVGR